MVKITPYVNNYQYSGIKKAENCPEIKTADKRCGENFTNPIITSKTALSFRGFLPESKKQIVIPPKEFDFPDLWVKNLMDEYAEGKEFPYYDADNARFSPEAHATTLPLKNDIDEKVIYISNFDDPCGTIAGSSTLDKPLYTDKLAQCAALAVVDKAHNVQSLIHVYPGYGVKDNKQILEHVLKASDPKDLELSIVPGYSDLTSRTVQFILDTLKELTPDVEPKLYNFPQGDLRIFKRGLLLKDGQLYACDMENVKDRITNPKENITYCKYEKHKFAQAKDLGEFLVSEKFPEKYNKKDLEKWAKDNNLNFRTYNGGFGIEFYDADENLVREVRACYPDEEFVRTDARYIYDPKGNLNGMYIYRRGEEPVFERI
ncbi:hypothetical protein IJI31_04910 [bacterium]|nr:hypothetical protein [bacterium]